MFSCFWLGQRNLTVDKSYTFPASLVLYSEPTNSVTSRDVTCTSFKLRAPPLCSLSQPLWRPRVPQALPTLPTFNESVWVVVALLHHALINDQPGLDFALPRNGATMPPTRPHPFKFILRKSHYSNYPHIQQQLRFYLLGSWSILHINVWRCHSQPCPAIQDGQR